MTEPASQRQPIQPPAPAPVPEAVDDPVASFESGAAAQLVRRRNRHLGNLFLADRAVFYVQILYRLLLFRREHELEPLHEDILDAVRPAQEALLDGAGYDADQFRNDLTQLEEWGLIRCRIEVERLRGYRDVRRRKFRYGLAADALLFLEWLEESAQAELDRSESDARDLLEEIGSTLNELHRLLNACAAGRGKEDDPRRVIYRLDRLNAMTTEVNSRLGELNAILLGFVTHRYTIDEAKAVLRELERFVDDFLRQIHALRGSIVGRIENLLETRLQEALRRAAEQLEQERRSAPHLFRHRAEMRHPERIPFRLSEFFHPEGRLDALCRRVHDSALKVWRKLHAHLRELERRSSRMDDLRSRIAELAALPEDAVPRDFLRELVAPAVMRADPNYWDDFERADPPLPRRRQGLERQPPAFPLRPKARQGGTVVSLDQARLEALHGWMLATLGASGGRDAMRLSRGSYADAQDFFRVMELVKAGILGDGARLRRVGYAMTPEPDCEAVIAVDDQRLTLAEMVVQPENAGRASEPAAP